MINIIKEGSLYPYQLTCFKCKCVFEFQDEDIHKDQVHMNEYIYRINCPTCGQDINSWTKEDWLK